MMRHNAHSAFSSIIIIGFWQSEPTRRAPAKHAATVRNGNGVVRGRPDRNYLLTLEGLHALRRKLHRFVAAP